MNPFDLAQLHMQLAHTITLMAEALIAAAFLLFCYWIAPKVR